MRSLLLLASCLVLTGMLSAQTVDHPLEYRDGVTAPKLVRQVEPRYPRPRFFGKTKEAVVLLHLVIDEKGQPQNVSVKTSGGDRFDKAAIEAVRQYRFSPAEKSGMPVVVPMDILINFKVY